MTTLFINDEEVTVTAGTSILEACRKHGADVPYFCYHPELSVAANCRMCLVEVEGFAKPAASCCTPVSEGMKVRTQSEGLSKDRQMVMEYLLIHHPLDCPVCDQGGACKLQDYTITHGANHGRYAEEKRAVVDHDLGPFVSTCMTRCIHCTRCVRFADEIAGTGDMGILNRSDHMKIDGIVEEALESELSGNLAEICPVGALLDKPSHDVSRPWEVTRHKSTCTQCPQGCDIVIESRGKEVIRIKSDHEGVESWICDRGRYVYDAFRSVHRISQPTIKEGDGSVAVAWDEAFAHAVNILKDKKVGIVFSPYWSVEGLASIRMLKDVAFKDAKVAFDLHRRDMRMFAFEEGFGSSTEDIVEADEVVILGSDLRQRLPILMQMLRKRSNEGKSVSRIGAMHYRTNSELSNDQIIRPRDWHAVIARAMQQLIDQGKPAAGMKEWMAKVTDRHEAGKVLADALLADTCCLLVGEEIRSHVDAASLIFGLDMLMRASGHGEVGRDGRNLIPEGMNAQLLSAVFGDVRVSVGELLDAANDGDIEALLLIGSDPLGDGLFPVEAKRAMGKVPMVQVGAIAGQISVFADVQLPAAAYSEVEGTFINQEGRIRVATQPLKSLGEERALWKIMMRLAQDLGFEAPAVSLDGVREAIAQYIPELKDVWAGKADGGWKVPVKRNRIAEMLPNDIEPAMALDVVSRYSMYREGAWVRASASLAEAGRLHALDDVIVHPDTLAALGLKANDKCTFQTSNGACQFVAGTRDDVSPGVLFVSKRGVAGDLSSETMVNLSKGGA
ncbi:MAG: NADH dehydrogenase (quinone) subunit G [Zetaproteobacteria bacterium CG_4_9_14_3_um_filter_49_83]|nr:MAG: NADH dehydrogenase (quinone) subunit G [Zetaproteobacteria bacterium CG1_02_49_23]PIQ30486.1 MAG: NADH dehydrogenase (quinone) subunit G [Zetaproteobacteria bacterium CG17_big_fil_post_rev_8_21_14_2_50_50_13]PIV29392.1 MAG: NADH dehydrogenase (quinone) subunit G [Zetaproteobacteria bacterium CG02_land_8_20_14_3_00_50_9]PIY55268.1 MAG: NADH dehydrogenase (quinone) subunit G [Zetaproteobacteria bacterium CG_4_10_14_0_8_um_filter_49_80]PJA36080.1 MAG: NADH dehydrogenase (quinone) subunit G